MEKAVYEEELIKNVIASVEKYGGRNCLSSIILTGSFGRNEPTYAMDADGNLKLKSDVEIALVFPKSSQKKLVEDLIRSVSSEFKEELNLMAINEKRVRKAYNFNFSVKVPKYKTIFTYDLFNGSRTIWGRDFIQEQTIALTDVDPYEAKRLVANRIGELTYLQNNANQEEIKYLRLQWKGKLMLAIVSAWLICENEYVSSYHGQYNKASLIQTKLEKLLGRGFFTQYQKVFLFLRENGEAYEVSDRLLRNYVKNIDDYFKEKKLESPKVNSFSRSVKYGIKYLRTGRNYGYCKFENCILQALITDFADGVAQLREDAEVWHKVLY